jgi:hypothetical protein
MWSRSDRIFRGHVTKELSEVGSQRIPRFLRGKCAKGIASSACSALRALSGEVAGILGATMSVIWVFKINHADPTFRVEYSDSPGALPERFQFDDIHELRHFLESHRLPGISSEQVLRELAASGRVEQRTPADWGGRKDLS